MPSNGIAGPAPRQGRLGALRTASAIDKLLRDFCVDGLVERCAGLEHRMHCDRKFACDRNSSAFEAEAIPELEPPDSQVALC